MNTATERTPTMRQSEMADRLGIHPRTLHRLAETIGYEHQGSGRPTNYLEADIPVFAATAAARAFTRGNVEGPGSAGLSADVLATIARQVADNGIAYLSETINGVTVTLMVDPGPVEAVA